MSLTILLFFFLRSVGPAEDLLWKNLFASTHGEPKETNNVMLVKKGGCGDWRLKVGRAPGSSAGNGNLCKKKCSRLQTAMELYVKTKMFI